MNIKYNLFSAALIALLLGALFGFCYSSGGSGYFEKRVCCGEGGGGNCFSGITLSLTGRIAQEMSQDGLTVQQERRVAVGQAFEEIGQSFYNAPANRIKTYMPYQAITNRHTEQYRMQQVAYTGEYGIRKVENRYCIAVGSGYTAEIGTWIDLVLANGTVIPCILADQKDNRHTDATNRITYDGSLAEFVVDIPTLSREVRHYGDISRSCPDWDSTVVGVIIYDKNEEF